MATTAPPAPTANSRPVNQPSLVPPEENMWVKYSPHNEAPLSFVGSLALHILVVVLLVIVGFLAYMYFSPPQGPLTVGTIQMGGGGGSLKGQGDAPGVGHGGEVVDAQPSKDPVESNLDVKRPQLTPSEAKKITNAFDNDPVVQRHVEKGTEALKQLARLNSDVREKLRDGVNPSAGRGGDGSGGGRGPGEGPDVGPGKGGGRLLNKSEKRMLRWSISFNTRDGKDDLAQLSDLGAILAVPIGDKEYQICDLSKQPYQFAVGDLSKIQRIYWIGDEPSSVRSLMSALGYNGRPQHFIAFMPEDLERKLADLELRYKGLKEDDIFETKFQCVRKDRKYDVVVTSQTPK